MSARRAVCGLAGALLAFAVAEAVAVPLKTAAGNPIANWVYFPGGVPAAGILPGSVEEDGSGPPSKITRDVRETEYTPEQRKKITDDDKAAHPSITVVGEPTAAYDCHGLTFKNRNFWIDNDQVDTILVDQGWKKRGDAGVPAAPAVGDVVIYRDAAGKVTHSGLVDAVAGGQVTRVRSKWGNGGEYLHDPNDVPAGYGTFEVRTGGVALADPPLDPEDLDVFGGLVPPPLKPELYDPFVNADFPLRFNSMPVPALHELTHGPTHWDYGLDIPQLGLQLTPGDTLSLTGSLWQGATVGGAALSPAFGAWAVQSVAPTLVRFVVTASAFVPGDFTGLIDGFTGISVPAPVGELVYIESVAGSLGRVSGPVPEPPMLALLGLGAVLARTLGCRAERGSRDARCAGDGQASGRVAA